MNKEPLLTVGSIGAVVAAVLILLRSFGANISDDQQNALLGFVAVVAPIVVGVVGRQFVYSPETTQKIADKAAATNIPDIGAPPDGAIKP